MSLTKEQIQKRLEKLEKWRPDGLHESDYAAAQAEVDFDIALHQMALASLNQAEAVKELIQLSNEKTEFLNPGKDFVAVPRKWWVEFQDICSKISGLPTPTHGNVGEREK